jgi:hypothetical protein
LEPEHPILYRAGLEYVQCECGGWTAHYHGENITRQALKRYLDVVIAMEIKYRITHGRQGVY